MSTTGTNGTTRKALVIGGGIAGPVMALALRRAGIEPVVFEAYPASAEGIGGTFMIAPNGLGALAVVGLEAEAGRIGQPVGAMVIEDGKGGVLAEFARLADLPPGRLMRRAELYEVLQRRLRETGVEVRYGKRLVGAEEGPDGITARFADGTSATGDLLIGADGTGSTVRTLIDPAAPAARYTGLLGVGGYSSYRLPGRAGRGESVHFANGARAFFGYWGLTDGSGTAWFSNIPQPEPLDPEEVRAVGAAEWLRRCRELHSDDLPAREVLRVADAATMEVFPRLEIMPSVPHWYRGRMVLVGDSVHAPSNSSGQGASLAVESAVELARCLRDLPGHTAAFAAYEAMRRPRVEKIAADAARTNSQKSSGPVGRMVFRLVAPIAVRTFMSPEKTLRPVHGYRIDWDRRVAPVSSGAAVTGP
ncbi:FAD-dependent monooxygenase [Streptomyces sp. CB01881]|uniref:FAD-dependent oxidoreductase n=1 Tax=Streptomyces sp. CB01881 TaxID=2078691 RepID=UPI000CDC7BBD|nr:FAD-dependent monooxygenase [Streptomyces sp. CB01881]AUY49406.1 monooxygenase [Streptomyces sp. CB01881]TYC72794.1 FAD-dependent monooxygenase [Streptomyces sp. CB01881]